MVNRMEEWDKSYLRKENFLFYPNEEIIRFLSKYIKQRIGIDEFSRKLDFKNALSLGCGIGRHVFFLDDFKFEAWGIDISSEAIKYAQKWALYQNRDHLVNKFITCSADNTPFENEYFDVIVSHGVFDSMRFGLAKKVMKEVDRITNPSSLVYLDLISGDDSSHFREYSGEEIIKDDFENNTIQSYYNIEKIKNLIDKTSFVIKDLQLIKREYVYQKGTNSRYILIISKSKIDTN